MCRRPYHAVCRGTPAGRHLHFLRRLPGLRDVELHRATSLFGLQQLTSLTSLGLRGQIHLDLTPLSELKSLQHVECIEMAPKHLLNLTALAALDRLSFTGMGVPVKLSSLSGLRSLQADSQPENYSFLLRALQQLKQLIKLDIPGSSALIEACAALPSLRSLCLTKVSMTAVAAGLSTLTQLQLLSLSACPPCTAGLLEPSLSGLTQLQCLHASDFCDEVVALPALTGLVLQFSDEVQPENGEVADLTGCSQLKQLHLSVGGGLHLSCMTDLPPSLVGGSLTFDCPHTGRLWLDAEDDSCWQGVLQKGEPPGFWDDRS